MMSDHTAVWKEAAHNMLGPHHEAAGGEPSVFTPLRLALLPHGFQFQVTQPDVIVGRHSDADIRLGHPDISRRHCRLVFAEGVWQMHDLRSLNGTYVNEQRLEEAVLFEGDRVRLGPWTLVVQPIQAEAHRDNPQTEMLKSIVNAIGEAPQMRKAS